MSADLPVLKIEDPPMSEEVRIVDPNTGGAKGMKRERYDLIPPDSLAAIARQFGAGAAKYGDRNWEQGYAWSLSFAAMMRHAWAFWNGEEYDAETGEPHLAAVAWHAMVLMHRMDHGREFDDRSSFVRPEPPTVDVDALKRNTEQTMRHVDQIVARDDGSPWLGVRKSDGAAMDDRTGYGDKCPSCGAQAGMCGPPDSDICDDRWHG